MVIDTPDVRQQLTQVKAQIAQACEKADRSPESVTLVAVSKHHLADHVRQAIDAGHRIFGENRVQEAQEKWNILRSETPGITLHLIGPLQSNKVKAAIDTFDVIETVDREKLARAITREVKQSGKNPDLFIQVNTGEEPQKAGIFSGDVDAFVDLCRDELGLSIKGLMCIPPQGEEPAPHFALLSKLAARNGLVELSMGMSSDFETAIDLGATHVRVGTAIFGVRT